jgi:uncharacterized protein with HEPN domain
MSRRDPRLPFFQVREHIKEILAISEGRSREDLGHDRLYNLAVTRLIEIIGEAANRVPVVFQSKYPKIPRMQLLAPETD